MANFFLFLFLEALLAKIQVNVVQQSFLRIYEVQNKFKFMFKPISVIQFKSGFEIRNSVLNRI